MDPANGLFTIDITINQNQAGKIAAGMFGSGTITVARSKALQKSQTESWSIPYDALLDGDGSSGYVFITNDDKTALKVKVVIGGVEKDHVVITQGLEKAKSLIISGSAYLTQNSPIQIIP